MDVDAALHELGMLSCVPDQRRQYLLECRLRSSIARSSSCVGRERKMSEPPSALTLQEARRTAQVAGRERKNSEPPVSTQTMTPPRTSITPSNSPTKGVVTSGFNVLKINPAFVTGVMISPGKQRDVRSKLTRDSRHCLMASERLDQENKDVICKRVKHAQQRAKRFRKPYECPWLQRHASRSTNQNIDSYKARGEPAPPSICLKSENVLNIQKSHFLDSSLSPSNDGNATSHVAQVHVQPVQLHVPSTEQQCSFSCDTTSELLSGSQRSKSLDELDFAKLRVAEQENQNYWLERKEIETVSQHMENLNVSE